MLGKISHGRITAEFQRDENWNWVVFAVLGMLVSIWLLGCATQSVEKMAPLKESSKDARIRELEEKLADKQEEIERLMGKLDGRQASTKPKATVKAKTVVKAETPKVPQSILPSEDTDSTLADSSQENMHYYYEALANLREQQYDKALQSLHRFLSLDPQHVYADRAQFLIAHTHFTNKEYGLAVVASNLLEARYPYSFKLPESLYERGLAYLEMKQEGQARNTLKNLIQNFPQSDSAQDAAKKLAQLMKPALDG